MNREEATQWLKHINITDFGWDDYAMQDSQKEIRERCEQSIREAIDMAIEALSVAVSREDTVTLNSPISIQAEMVAVVRCKDCRFYWGNLCEDDTDEMYGECRWDSDEMPNDDDFCSYGERAEQTEYKLPGHDEVMDALDKLTIKQGGNDHE